MRIDKNTQIDLKLHARLAQRKWKTRRLLRQFPAFRPTERDALPLYERILWQLANSTLARELGPGDTAQGRAGINRLGLTFKQLNRSAVWITHESAQSPLSLPGRNRLSY